MYIPHPQKENTKSPCALKSYIYILQNAKRNQNNIKHINTNIPKPLINLDKKTCCS